MWAYEIHRKMQRCIFTKPIVDLINPRGGEDVIMIVIICPQSRSNRNLSDPNNQLFTQLHRPTGNYSRKAGLLQQWNRRLFRDKNDIPSANNIAV